MGSSPTAMPDELWVLKKWVCCADRLAGLAQKPFCDMIGMYINCRFFYLSRDHCRDQSIIDLYSSHLGASIPT